MHEQNHRFEPQDGVVFRCAACEIEALLTLICASHLVHKEFRVWRENDPELTFTESP